MSVLRTYLVEDNPVIRDNLADTLQELANVEVVGTAADEATALDRLDRGADDIDLMIIDLFLSSGSGMTVLRSAQEMNIKAKCVVLTNYATHDIRRRCAALGADRVFDKSSEIEDLIDYCGSISDGSPTVASG